MNNLSIELNHLVRIIPIYKTMFFHKQCINGFNVVVRKETLEKISLLRNMKITDTIINYELIEKMIINQTL